MSGIGPPMYSLVTRVIGIYILYILAAPKNTTLPLRLTMSMLPCQVSFPTLSYTYEN